MILLLDNQYECTVLRDGFRLQRKCGAAGKHATSSVAVHVIPYVGDTNIANVILMHDGYMPATLKDGDTTLFTGVVRPYITQDTTGPTAGSVSLEVMDYTETTQEYIWGSPTDGAVEGRIYTALKQNINLSDLLVWLFGLAGKTFTPFTTSETVSYFKLPAGEYLADVITELLYEYGLDYRWTAEGVAEVFSTFPDDQPVGEITDIRGSLSIARSDDTTDGLKLTWKEYSYQDNVKIYKFDSGNLGADLIQSLNWTQIVNNVYLDGKLWNGMHHDSYYNKYVSMPDGNLWSWYLGDSGLQDNEGKTITTSNILEVTTDVSRIHVSLEDETGVEYSVTLESYDTEGMRMWVNYKGLFDVWLRVGWRWKIEAYGDLKLAIDSEASYNVVGPSPENITLSYRMGEKGSDVISETFAKQFALRQKASKFTCTFRSLTEYTCGAFYKLTNSVTALTSTVRITSCTRDENGIYSYEAEGAGLVSEDAATLTLIQERKAAIENAAAYTPEYIGIISEASEDTSKKYKQGAYGVLESTNTLVVNKGYGQGWTEITKDDAFDATKYNLDMLTDAFPDMLKLGTSTSTTSTLYGVFQKLCADEAFIKYLKAYRVLVGSSESGFNADIGVADDGSTVFKVQYNGSTVFQIDPATGNVFMGRPNSDLSAPETGFMYRADDQTIVSGTGLINVANGYFAGKFDTACLKSVPNVAGGIVKTATIPATSGSESRTSVRWDAFNSLYASLNTDATTLYGTSNGESIILTRSQAESEWELNVGYYLTKADGTEITKSLRVYNKGHNSFSYYNYVSVAEVTFTISFGGGDILVLKDIQEGSAGLETGQVYRDSNGFLKIVT